MELILALLAASAATGIRASPPPPVPDSAATLVPVTLPELRRFADALAELAKTTGETPNQILFGKKPAPAQRDGIVRAHGLSPARFDYIAEQVRYNEHMQQVVREELIVARGQAR